MARPERAEDVWGGHFVHRLGRLRKTDLLPLRGGRVFKRVPGVKNPRLSPIAPFGAETEFFKGPFKVNAYGLKPCLKPWAILFSHFMACFRQSRFVRWLRVLRVFVVKFGFNVRK
jgi:hypothetical protein